MVPETLMLAFTALQTLTGGIRFASELSGSRISLTVSLRQAVTGRRSVLAFIRVTNESDVPWTVTDFELRMGGQSTRRVPSLSVDIGADTGDSLLASTPPVDDIFNTGRSLGVSVLDDDAYLQPRESKGGWVMFAAPEKPPLSRGTATLSVCVGDDHWIHEDFKIPSG